MNRKRKAVVSKYAIVGKGTKIGRGTKVWNYANLYGRQIGDNCVIASFCEIGQGVTVGNGCKIECRAFIPSGVEIADDVFIGPAVTFTNDKYPGATGAWNVTKTRVERGASLGANSTIICGITICEGAMVGAGSVVTHDVEPHTLVVGNPAHKIKSLNPKCSHCDAEVTEAYRCDKHPVLVFCSYPCYVTSGHRH